MKQVTFTKDMAPHKAGESRVLPDPVADRLVASGEASDPRPFPPADVAPATAVGDAAPPRKPGKFYQTRARR